MSEDRFTVRAEGYEVPDLSLRQIMRMRERGDLKGAVEYYHRDRKEWRPLLGIVVDMYPDRLIQMREVGITHVELLLSGENGHCPVCVEMAGKPIPISEARPLPLPSCTCEPWCRVIWGATAY